MRPIFDENWRLEALQGRPSAIGALQTVLEPLYNFCLFRVGKNQHWCEEVVQETMLRALRDLANYDPGRARNHILPWLIGLARNEIQRLLQREKAAVSLQTLSANMDPELLQLYAKLESESLDPELLHREETRDLVNATMSELPQHYREMLEAKYLLGKSMRDMAAEWQTSEKAIESNLVRARRAFRAIFEALSRHLQTEMC